MLVELKRAVRYRAWVSGHPAFLLSQSFDHERNMRRGFTDEDHLRAAAQWLAAVEIDPSRIDDYPKHFSGGNLLKEFL